MKKDYKLKRRLHFLIARSYEDQIASEIKEIHCFQNFCRTGRKKSKCLIFFFFLGTEMFNILLWPCYGLHK